MTAPPPDRAALLAEARGLDWYHTFDLPGGGHTPGLFDLRRTVERLPIPASLAGKRCLDVAASDGFFSLELARRGAAEVVSLDLADATRQDWQGPPGTSPTRQAGSGRAARAFELITALHGIEGIKRIDGSVYDISPDSLGRFDFVFMGNILMHLGDPGRAMRAVRSVVEGQLLSLEGVNLTLSVLSPRLPVAQLWDGDDARWWTHNLAGHRRIVEAGGFAVDRHGGPFFVPIGDHFPKWPKKRPTLREAFWLATVRRRGTPSQWVLASPRHLRS